MVMQVVAWIASLFVFLSFFMKTMIPLRIIAIVSNCTFITYALLGVQAGIFDKVYPIFVLHVLLLPLNIVRLYQMKQLIRRVNDASRGDDEIGYLIPYMRKKSSAAGDFLFRRGDEADRIFFIESGSIHLPEIDKTLPPGSVLGEVGIFAPDNTRAASARCVTDCVVYEIHRDRVLELYYQNPRFGFYIIKTISRIARENTDMLTERSG